MAKNEPTQIVLPYEQDAMQGKELPEGLDMPDMLMYLGLRFLYIQYRTGAISRELATEEKRKLLRKYKYQIFLEETCKRCVQQVKNTEMARARYRQERTLENADKLVNILEGKKYGS